VPEDASAPAKRRRVNRGEGEVTEWPRGLSGYVPTGPDDASPSAEEDRTGNRLRLAARLLALLRAQGRDVDREIRELREAERAFEGGEKTEAARRIDRLLGEIDEASRDTR
jgi:hypothetical protein